MRTRSVQKHCSLVFTRHGQTARGVIVAVLLVFSAANCSAEEVSRDWNQWRGPQRTGVDPNSPELRGTLPPGGLKPVWISEEVPSGFSGGWGSPIVAGGRVYLFAHSKTKNIEGEVPPKKFPWLPADKRGGMTPAQYEEYEKNRRDEDQARGKYFEFRERIYCFSADTGELLWKNEQPSFYCRFLQSGSPAIVDGKLYILGAGRFARCLDAATGADLWKTRLPGEFRDEYMMSSFAVADGAAVALCGHLFGLDASTGEILWQGDVQQTSGTHNSPVVWEHAGHSYVIVNVAGSETVCVDPKSGKELWRVDSQAGLATPVVVGDHLITYGNSRKKGLRCFKISPEKAEQAWVYQRINDKGSSPVVLNGYVYAQGEKRLACVDLKTGKDEWSTLLDLAKPQYTSLVAGDGKVFYAYDGLLMFAADPKEFRPLIEAKFDQAGLLAPEADHRKRLGIDELEKQADGLEKAAKIYDREIAKSGPLACCSPALCDGRLYLRMKSDLRCYDLRAATTLSSVRP